jgi:hypothetical protein
VSESQARKESPTAATGPKTFANVSMRRSVWELSAICAEHLSKLVVELSSDDDVVSRVSRPAE